MTETTNNLRYDGKQEEQLLESYAKRNGMDVSEIFCPDEDDAPKISLQKSEEGNIFSTLGLGHVSMFEDPEEARSELMMTVSQNFDTEDSDSVQIILNELACCVDDHLSSEGNYMIHCTDVSESFREMFGYDHIWFIKKVKSIDLLENLGPIYMRVALPLYEEEWQYICKTNMDSNVINRFVRSMLDWYDDHDVIVGAVDVERDVIAPAKSVCH